MSWEGHDRREIGRTVARIVVSALALATISAIFWFPQRAEPASIATEARDGGVLVLQDDARTLELSSVDLYCDYVLTPDAIANQVSTSKYLVSCWPRDPYTDGDDPIWSVSADQLFAEESCVHAGMIYDPDAITCLESL